MSGRAIRALAPKVAGLPTVGAKLVLYHLMAKHREGGGEMKCSVSALARDLGLSRTTVLAALEALERQRLAVRMGGVIVLQMPEETVQPLNSSSAEGCSATEQATVQPLNRGCTATEQKVFSHCTPLKEEEEKEEKRAPAPEGAHGSAAMDEIGYREKPPGGSVKLGAETNAYRSPATEAQRRIWRALGVDGEEREVLFDRLMADVERARSAGDIPEIWENSEYERILWVYRHRRGSLALSK